MNILKGRMDLVVWELYLNKIIALMFSKTILEANWQWISAFKILRKIISL